MTPDTDRKEDALLALRCQLGERAAFDELAARWHGPLWGYVRRLVSSDDAAAEIVQDAWVRIVRGVSGLRDPSKLRAWLFAVTRRTLMDRLRGKYAGPVETDIDMDAVAANAPDIELEVRAEQLDRALERLPPIEREVLTLFYLRELSLGEVSETLAVPVGTIKSRLHRARHLLRQQMNEGVQT